METYDRLAKIVDQANSIMSSLYLQSKMKETEHNLDLKLDKDEERAHFFRPALSCNVIFCSAIDGFGFTVRSMARQFWRSDKSSDSERSHSSSVFSGVTNFESVMIVRTCVRARSAS